MISPEIVMENVKYFNKLYKDGVSSEHIKHLINTFEYANEWGNNYGRYGFYYCPIIPLDWKEHLNPKIFKDN